MAHCTTSKISAVTTKTSIHTEVEMLEFTDKQILDNHVHDQDNSSRHRTNSIFEQKTRKYQQT